MNRKILEELLDKLSALREELNEGTQEAKALAKRLLDAVDRIDESSSHSWFGYHSRFYYRGFRRPPPHEAFDVVWGGMHGIPPNWTEQAPDAVVQWIEATSGTTVDDVLRLTRPTTDKMKPLYEDITIALSPIRGLPAFQKEISLLDELEKLSWELSVSDAVAAISPQRAQTLDVSAASQGIQTPPHRLYQGRVISAIFSALESEKLFDQASRLLRQVLERLPGLRTASDPSSALARVRLICGRFPQVARQLQRRVRNRPPYEIKDEYDVQDLLHALLKLDFDDVRPEEWTPSYAGAAARMDFLLKGEGLVVEAKMARLNRASKAIGEELLIDIARYQTNPECKHLVCFIYDPSGLLPNPIGLTADLERRGAQELKVVVLIAPLGA